MKKMKRALAVLGIPYLMMVMSAALYAAEEDLVEIDVADSVAGSCVAPAEVISLAGPITTKAFCSADCGPGAADLTCSVGGCTPYDRNCSAGERGRILNCGSSGTLTCPTPCGCTEGAIRYTQSSSCCCDYSDPDAPVSRYQELKERCVNGNWVYAGVFCIGQSCSGTCAL